MMAICASCKYYDRYTNRCKLPPPKGWKINYVTGKPFKRYKTCDSKNFMGECEDHVWKWQWAKDLLDKIC